MTLSSALTLTRASLALPIGVAATSMGYQTDHWPTVLLVLYTLAAASDALDGPLARRRGEVTPLGAFLDPLADKLVTYAVLVPVALRTGEAPLVALVAALAARDVVVTWRRSLLLRLGAALEPTRLARLKAILLYVAVGVFVGAPTFGIDLMIGRALLAAGVAAAILSAVQHFQVPAPRAA